MAEIKAVLIILVLTMVSLILIPLQWIAIRLQIPICRKLPQIWHLIATRLVGIRIQQIGGPSPDRPLLITSNHASWVDITVIGSLMPLSFIAKSEVSRWPVFGLLAKLQRTVFVDRTKRSRTAEVTDTIAGRMGAGDAMVLFAEGTSNDGNRVLPFRSALLGAATRAVGNGGQKVWVQPLSVAYQGFYGLPMGRAHRPHVAWYGDMELAGHLWGVFARGSFDVIVRWGDPVLVDGDTDRKALTRQLEREVRAMTAASLHQKPIEHEDSGESGDSDEIEPFEFFSNAEKPGKAGV
ncbi:lysophospholipid acyltransferase family protein [Labrenzia sp. OB1]|uniref:lysophospholipid acyltransferase family protein n=1 Tax=Labrenzia sp. OB1 TaxID=1561204 RepID=UPI0007B1A630|nr:lysophospholipid acyltransferase family protein [Labrenzia sp. OB1]KZM50816.1 acyl-phosphate glycerol 3-phosphate acyltransferase [Labrenzia sp. OB1]